MSHCFICADGMNLCAEHDASEEREKESFKHSKQCENENQWPRHQSITPCTHTHTHTHRKGRGRREERGGERGEVVSNKVV